MEIEFDLLLLLSNAVKRLCFTIACLIWTEWTMAEVVIGTHCKQKFNNHPAQETGTFVIGFMGQLEAFQ